MKSLIQNIMKETSWDYLEDLSQWVIQQAIVSQQIPAPTFHEQDRAAFVAEQFQALSLHQVEQDHTHNVYGLLPGHDRSTNGIMIVAHTDTVFSLETDLSIKRENNRVYGPGLGDNSIGVASILGLAKMFTDKQIVPACDLWFVATTGEEGLGDLKGMKVAFDRYKSSINSVINLEGLAFGHIYHAGIAVHRLHITATAQGGHSWLHYGRPSAVHAIIDLGSRLTQMQPPKDPRTTYNIGMIEGGQAINAIGTEAGLWLDMRSESQPALDTLRQQVSEHIKAAAKPGVQFHTEVVGDRPAGMLDTQHPLVQGAMEVLNLLGTKPALETGSTDANVPLAAGYPAVTIGITRGGNAHRLDEYIETEPVRQGMKQLVTLVLATAQYQAQNHMG